MRTTRWMVVGLTVPALAALGIACDQRTPTEALRSRDASGTVALNSRDSDDDNDGNLKAVPFVFVGSADECGGVAGTPIPTAAWLGGMGLPDDGGMNGPTNRSERLGLLLSKNGLTTDCSSSGARIKGVRGMRAGPILELGFDVRNGTHCGGGAPRFNVTVREPKAAPRFFFVGNCATGVQTPAPQDPLQWTRVRFATPLPAGTTIESISILYDEGTDTPGAQDPMGVGLSVIDNIDINGQLIRRGKGIAEPHGDRGDRDSDKD